MALTTDILAYYKLDWNSNDSVGSNDWTDTSITYWTDYGKINQWALFNGSSSEISIWTSTDFDFSNNFTVSFWFKNSRDSSYRMFIRKNYITVWTYRWWNIIKTKDNKVRFEAVTGTGTAYQIFSNSVISNNTYTNCVCVMDGGVLKMYINWVLQTDTKGAVMTAAVGYPLEFWSEYRNNGSMDEVWIRDRALTSTEITELYNSWDWLQYPFTSTAIQKIYLWATQLQSFKLGSTDIKKIYLWATEVFSK